MAWVDAHHHFWRISRGDYDWMQSLPPRDAMRQDFLPLELVNYLQPLDIAQTVLVQAAATTAETEYMLGLADALPFVSGVVGWIDFTDANARHQLERFAQHPKFLGVRPMVQDEADPLWLERADIQWAFDAVAELDLCFDALGRFIHLSPFARMFARKPKLRIVIDHAMKPPHDAQSLTQWSQQMAHIAKETAVLCKFSGLVTEAPTGATQAALPYLSQCLLEHFGSERVMWGSDWPPVSTRMAYSAWFHAARALVPAGRDTDNVFAATAKRFYRI